MRILPGMGGLGIGDIMLALRTGLLEAMECPSQMPKRCRKLESESCLDVRSGLFSSGLVGHKGHRSLWPVSE